MMTDGQTDDRQLHILNRHKSSNEEGYNFYARYTVKRESLGGGEAHFTLTLFTLANTLAHMATRAGIKEADILGLL